MEVTFGKGTANPKDGSVVDSKDPKLDDPDSPVYSVVCSSSSVEEGEIEDDDP